MVGLGEWRSLDVKLLDVIFLLEGNRILIRLWLICEAWPDSVWREVWFLIPVVMAA